MDENTNANGNGNGSANPLRLVAGLILSVLLAGVLVILFVLNSTGRWAHKPPAGVKKVGDARRARGRLKAPANPADIPALMTRLRADVDALVDPLKDGSNSGRTAGSPGAKKVAELIAARFTKAGLAPVVMQRYPVAVPVTHELPPKAPGESPRKVTEFKVGEQSYEILPLTPNLVRTSTIDAENNTIQARLVWGGDGQLARLRGKDVAGSILVLEEDEGYDWLTACSLGARAVIFVEPANARKLRPGLKVLGCALDIPRFWIGRREAEKALDAADPQSSFLETLKAGKRELTASLTCRVDWVNREVVNVWGLMPGANPEKRKDLSMVVVHYDSTSIAPGLAPGAEAASSVAAMFELIERMKKDPPERSVLFLAVGAHYPAMAGEAQAMELLRLPVAKLLAELGGGSSPTLDSKVLGWDGKTVKGAKGQEISGMRPWQRVLLIVVGFVMLLVAGGASYKLKLKFKRACAVIACTIVFGGIGLGVLGGWWGRTRKGEAVKKEDLWTYGGYVALRAAVEELETQDSELAKRLQATIERREEIECAALEAHANLKTLFKVKEQQGGAVDPEWRGKFNAQANEFNRKARLAANAEPECREMRLELIKVLEWKPKKGEKSLAELASDYTGLQEVLDEALETAKKKNPALVKLVKAVGECRDQMDEVEERLKTEGANRLKYVRMAGYLAVLAELGPDVPERLGSCVGIDLSSHSDSMAILFKGKHVNHFIQSDEKRLQSAVGPVAEYLSETGSAQAKAQGWRITDKSPFVTDTTVTIGGRNWMSVAPGGPCFSTEVLALGGFLSITFATALDERARLNTPLDLPEHMDFEKLARQTEVLCRSLTSMFHPGSPEVSPLDVNSWTGLARRLTGKGAEAGGEERLTNDEKKVRRVRRALAGRVRDLLSAEVRATLGKLVEKKAGEKPHELTSEEKLAVAGALSAIMKAGKFYGAAELPGLDLKGEAGKLTKKLAKKHKADAGKLSADERLRLSRMVLEAALPQLVRLVDRERGLAALERAEAESGLKSLKMQLRIHGQITEYNPAKSKTLSVTPVPGALVICRWEAKIFRRYLRLFSSPVRPDSIVIADRYGAYEVFGRSCATMRAWADKDTRVLAYQLDPESGNVIKAPDEGPEGKKRGDPWRVPKKNEDEFIVATFACQALNIFEASDLRSYAAIDTQFQTVKMYKGRVDEVPISFGWSMVGETSQFAYPEHAMVIFTERRAKPGKDKRSDGPPIPVQLKGTFGRRRLTGVRWPVLGVRSGEIDKDSHTGHGVTVSRSARLIDPDSQEFDKDGKPVPGSGTPMPLSMIMAQDLYRMDGFRMSVLEKAGVKNRSLVDQHDSADRELKLALKAKGEKHWDEMMVHARNSWGYEARAYPNIHSTVTDVVKGLLFYLFLMLPFAYFMERLLFSSPSVNRQLAGVFGLFMASFGVLYFVHPAFGITTSAPMILLSFITIALAVLVIGMISSRFKRELASLQHRPGRSHKADMDRINAMISAFLLGINNMRRRKVRTLLTMTTLVLLTFSVLSFSSIESVLGTNKRLINKESPIEPPYQGLLVRNESWLALDELAARSLRDDFARPEKKCLVAPRAWWAKAETTPARIMVNADNPEDSFELSGILGVRAVEREVTGLGRPDTLLPGGRWFYETEVRARAPVCLLPEYLMGKLKLDASKVTAVPDLSDPADFEKYAGKLPRVTLEGVEMAVIGVLKTAAYHETVDIDGERIVPVDLNVESWQRQSGLGKASDQLEFRKYQHQDAKTVPVVPYDWLMGRKEGKLYSVALVPEDPGKITDIAEGQLLRRISVPIFVARKDESGTVRTMFMSTTTASNVSGMGSLIVPMLIAALIVLNTMLGSVYEREGEISIYGSLGLAPVHIGSLFLAESAVFAVCSAVLGYILGQSVSKLVVIVGSEGMLSGFSLNYSSLSAVFSACFIITVVMLSAAYPAMRAGQLSVPDVERIWKFPEAKDDRLVFDFPFTVSGEQALGVNMHLKQFFEDHANQSVGEFYTANTGFDYRQPGVEKGGYKLLSQVWVAPFDFGISQGLEMETYLAEDETDIYETRMILTRISGSPESWVKMNHRFMKSIRKQFLLWRLFTNEERAWHVAQARVLLGEISPDQVPDGLDGPGGAEPASAPQTG